MKHLFVGIVSVVISLSVFTIGFVALDEPLSIIFDSLSDAYPEDMDGHDDVVNFNDSLIYFFYAAIGLGVILTFVWFAFWSQKEEYEKFGMRKDDERY